MVPILAYRTNIGERVNERLAGNDAPAAVDFGRRRLDSNEMDATVAALAYVGRIPIDDQKSDVVVIEIQSYASRDSRATVAVPYTPYKKGSLFKKQQSFVVHEPQLLVWDECDEFDQDAMIDAFYEGVDLHKEGSEVWNQCSVDPK